MLMSFFFSTDFGLLASKMRRSPSSPLRVNVLLFLIGSLFQTSHLLDISDSVPINGGRRMYVVSRETVLHSGSSAEDGGSSYGGAESPQSRNPTVSLEEPKRSSFENPSGFEIPEKYQRSRSPHDMETSNQELERLKALVRKITPSTLLSEDGSHLKESPASPVTSDSLTSKFSL